MCKSLVSVASGFAVLVLSACSGLQSTFAPAPSPTAPGPQSTTQTYAIYVSEDANRRFSNAPPVIAAYAVTANNRVRAVAGSPFVDPGGTSNLLPAAAGKFLFANNSDIVDPTTGVQGPNKGIYSFGIAPDGSLSAPSRLTETFFPASITQSGAILYLSQPQPGSATPIAVRTYVVDPSTSQLTITPHDFGTGAEGAEPFFGQTETTPSALWVKTGWPPLCNTDCTTSKFNRSPINNENGALLTVDMTSTSDVFDMFAQPLATSDHFLLLLDGISSGNKVLRLYANRDELLHVQDYAVGPSLTVFSVAIHPSENFAFVQTTMNSVSTVPLNDQAGLQFDRAFTVALQPATAGASDCCAMALSTDGKILAITRYDHLEIFAVAADGTLTRASGSPIQLPFLDPSILTVVPLPPQ